MLESFLNGLMFGLGFLAVGIAFFIILLIFLKFKGKAVGRFITGMMSKSMSGFDIEKRPISREEWEKLKKKLEERR